MFRVIRLLDENIRVLPVLIVAAGVLLFAKSSDLWTDVQGELVGISTAQAVETTQSASAGFEPEGEGHDDPFEAAAPENAPRTVDRNADYYGDRGAGLSLAEVQVLESLSARREALDGRENDIIMRERLIEAAERRVEERINELRTLEARIEELLLLRDEEEEAQMESLVSVYENMRAKDAAAIFERLEDGILVDVASRMREQRIALILAEMAPERAQELTVRLATRMNFPDTEGAE